MLSSSLILHSTSWRLFALCSLVIILESPPSLHSFTLHSLWLRQNRERGTLLHYLQATSSGRHPRGTCWSISDENNNNNYEFLMTWQTSGAPSSKTNTFSHLFPPHLFIVDLFFNFNKGLNRRRRGGCGISSWLMRSNGNYERLKMTEGKKNAIERKLGEVLITWMKLMTMRTAMKFNRWIH